MVLECFDRYDFDYTCVSSCGVSPCQTAQRMRTDNHQELAQICWAGQQAGICNGFGRVFRGGSPGRRLTFKVVQNTRGRSQPRSRGPYKCSGAGHLGIGPKSGKVPNVTPDSAALRRRRSHQMNTARRLLLAKASLELFHRVVFCKSGSKRARTSKIN